jgi:hypothetical protein
MLAEFLLPEIVARADGSSAAIALEGIRGKSLLLTLGITRILEQESLDVSIWGSADEENWRLIGAFPQKFYCGTYSLCLDLSHRPEIAFLQVQWRMGRWGCAEPEPLFGFYVSAEEAHVHVAGMA